MNEVSQAQGQSQAPAVAAEILSGYQSPPENYDELVGPEGTIRPHWKWLIDALSAHDEETFSSLRRQARRMVRDHGLAHNYHRDSKSSERPWALDLLPVVITAEDWHRVEAGIQQRARLFNAILADLYGPRNAILQHALPPEFVFANPRFLRACDGMPIPKYGHVGRYGADLIRTPDGVWRVISDRAEAPAGAGFALENRIVIGRTYPDLMEQGPVRRLVSFFSRFRDLLHEVAPVHEREPSIALLTPGPSGNVYFEHVFLARYLGIDVVETEDLAARDNRLYLRTIAGLRQIDVLLRRIRDSDCDPLELVRGSGAGVAGLIQAMRSGNVVACNAVGVGMLDCPCMAAVLPRLCQFYLGETLQLESVAAWWGGVAEQRDYIEENFDSLQIVDAFGAGPEDAVIPQSLTQEERDALYRRWRQRPHEIAALDNPRPSVVPVWSKDGVEARALTIRTYAVAGDTITVMPGGLGRYFSLNGRVPTNIEGGFGAKDVWVLADGPEDFRSMLPPQGQRIEIRRSPNNVSSRLAENLLWLGRYCERCDGSIRALRHLLVRCVDEEEQPDAQELYRLAEAIPHLFAGPTRKQIAAAAERLDDAAGDPRAENEMRHIIRNAVLDAVHNTDRQETVASTLASLRRASWVAREYFSQDDWRILNGFINEFFRVQRNALPLEVSQTLSDLNELITGLAAFGGLVHENMTREPGRVFLELGKRIERATFTMQLLLNSLRVVIEPEAPLLRGLLAICDSPITYQRRYGINYDTPLVLDLLICDDTNPRSFVYQMMDIGELFTQLPAMSHGGLLSDEQRLVVQMRNEVQIANVYQWNAADEKDRRVNLVSSLTETLKQLASLSSALGRRYFVHTAPARQAETIIDRPAP